VLMLTSVLPGVRDVRTPLTAGYLWLLSGYLALAPLVDLDPHHGAARDLSRLVDRGGEAATAVALSFVAYVVGVLAQGLIRPLLVRATTPELIPLARVSLNGQSPQATRADRAAWPLRRAIRAQFQSRIESDRVVRDEFIRRCEAVEGILSKLRGDGHLRKHHTLGFESRTQYDELIGDGALSSDLHAVMELLIPVGRPYDPAVRELRQIPTRLLGRDSDLWNSWDRLRAEAEFRVSAALPIGSLGIVLAFRGTPWWCALIIPAAYLAYLGYVKSLEAVALLAETVAAGRVESDVLRSVAADEVPWREQVRWHADGPVILLTRDSEGTIRGEIVRPDGALGGQPAKTSNGG
jgi:hypothetical protein